MDSLESYCKHIVDSTVVRGLMIIHEGKEVLMYGDVEENSYIASCRKSVRAMLYGQYVEDGTIHLVMTIGQRGIDDVEGILPRVRSTTIHDLIWPRTVYIAPKVMQVECRSLSRNAER